jgi:hypothetical protein
MRSRSSLRRCARPWLRRAGNHDLLKGLVWDGCSAAFSLALPHWPPPPCGHRIIWAQHDVPQDGRRFTATALTRASTATLASRTNTSARLRGGWGGQGHEPSPSPPCKIGSRHGDRSDRRSVRISSECPRRMRFAWCHLVQHHATACRLPPDRQAQASALTSLPPRGAFGSFRGLSATWGIAHPVTSPAMTPKIRLTVDG